jgi:nicotinamide riboside transporter PnuC
MRRWITFPRSAKIKTVGYAISVVSVALLAIVSWKNAATNPLLAVCLFGGASTSIIGMGLRWWSYEIEETEKQK